MCFKYIYNTCTYKKCGYTGYTCNCDILSHMYLLITMFPIPSVREKKTTRCLTWCAEEV